MRPPKPYQQLLRGPRALKFYLGDSVEILRTFPNASTDVVVTSPPYNLGIQYRSYDDGRPRPEYLKWTGEWVAAVARVLAPDGSLFLNVGAKPTEPWTALDVAQAARPHLQLQNLIHWIKSISIEAEAAGARSGLARCGRASPLRDPVEEGGVSLARQDPDQGSWPQPERGTSPRPVVGW